ncbi:28S ribosomal protein S6, mitochondrial [Pleodorina starrii]|uniref:28S ribosomal protein S6, mitochondrial n=1 Tax=Pleodorina starrii TaxID=330485 RepID=A0A9W6F5X7_9CHLO|nr:28S ribosomal protein S6 [Pleodorina starrii]GLC57479.1 28S ribosomal protein S6, mitochondrial [Pleodorina starrii]GLC63151.1 28S ribosomal protein S6 [Pleodorina starrii]
MPLYELLCLAKPAPRAELVALFKNLGDVVYKNGGFITQLKSFGEQHLAYDLRQPFEKHDRAHIWQMDFVSSVDGLKPLDHELHVSDKVLRWTMVKRPMGAPPAALAASSEQR